MLTLALALACAGKGDSDSAPEAAPPVLSVEPLSLDFGAVALDALVPAEETLTLTNAGEGVLVLSELALTAGGPFALAEQALYSLNAGESVTIGLLFQPTTPGDALDTLSILSTDPAQPTAAVALSGFGQGPALTIEPSGALDLGPVLLGCSAAQDILLRNSGNEDLEISAVQLSGDGAFALDLLPADNGVFPWTLAPEAALSVRVSYTPGEALAQTATLRVNSDDPLAPARELALSATGQSFGQIEDRFTADAKLDVVFAIDTTSATQAPLNQLQDDITLLTDHLRREGADGQVSAVVADDGCVLGGVVAFDPSLAADEQRRVFAAMSGASPGALAQQPFNLLSAAVTGASGCNAGLLREDAVAAFVGFTARDDQSGNSARVSVEGLQAQVSRPSRLLFSAVAGPTPSGCGSASSANTLDQAVTLTDGVFSSICASNYRNALEDIADAAIARSLGSVRLSAEPVPASLYVELRGVERTSGWRYDEAERAVLFEEGSGPNLGDSVVVRYEARAEQCE